MSFTDNQTGIEDYATGTTQVVFTTPVIVAERDAETPADAVHDIAVSGEPIVVVYTRTQAKSVLRLSARLLVGTNLANLRTLMAAGEPVVVKTTPGNATTITCMFGPRKDQELEPWNGDHADAQGDGSALDPLLEQYKAELFLLRFS